MANTIKIRRSATSGATPTTSQLALGELAINTYDGKLFLKKDDGSASVIEVGGQATSSTPRKVLLYEKANTGSADSFDGTETRFQLRDENGAIIDDIASAYQLLISIDGVVQESNSSSSGTDGFYITNNTASGTDIVFLAAPASGSDFFGTSVTTANFYVNNISESGSTTTVDGLLNVTGEIQAENIAIGPNTQGHGLLTLSKSSSSAFNALVIQQGNTGSTASDGLHIGIDTAVDAYIIHKENRDIIFGTSNSEAMRISSDGNIGIGGTATGSFGGINKGVLITGTNAQVGLRVETSHGSSGILEVSAESGGVKFDTRGSGHFRFGSAGDEFLRIDNAGLVGIGTSTLNEQLNVHGASGAQVQFRDNGTGEAASAGLRVGWNGSMGQMWLFENAPIRFATANGERMRLDPSGRLLVGTGNAPAGTDAQYSRFVIRGNTINSNGAYLSLGNNKTTANTTSDDNLGLITFNDSDSDAGEYARIVGASDGANGTNDYPGKLIFSTTADGGSSPTERMRVDSSGRLLVNATGVGSKSAPAPVQIKASTSGAFALSLRNRSNNDYSFLTFTDTGATEDLCQIGTYRSGGSTGSLLFYTNSGNSSGSEKMRILSGGGITFNGDTAQANALDDYEEGTWTPAVSQGVTNVSHQSQQGIYTKIGNLLHFYLNIQVDGGTPNNSLLQISGLPYLSNNSISHYTTCTYYLNKGKGTYGGQLKPLVFPNDNKIKLYKQNNQNIGEMKGNDVVKGEGTDRFQILLSGTYRVA